MHAAAAQDALLIGGSFSERTGHPRTTVSCVPRSTRATWGTRAPPSNHGSKHAPVFPPNHSTSVHSTLHSSLSGGLPPNSSLGGFTTEEALFIFPRICIPKPSLDLTLSAASVKLRKVWIGYNSVRLLSFAPTADLPVSQSFQISYLHRTPPPPPSPPATPMAMSESSQC